MKKTKKTRALTLHRETLRTLTTSDMRRVPGGLFSMQTDTTCTDLSIAPHCGGGGGGGSLSFDDCTSGCL